MKKWYDEEYEWEIEVTGFLRSDHTERYCRNGEEVGDKYTCTYGINVKINLNNFTNILCTKSINYFYQIF